MPDTAIPVSKIIAAKVTLSQRAVADLANVIASMFCRSIGSTGLMGMEGTSPIR